MIKKGLCICLLAIQFGLFCAYCADFDRSMTRNYQFVSITIRCWVAAAGERVNQIQLSLQKKPKGKIDTEITAVRG